MMLPPANLHGLARAHDGVDGITERVLLDQYTWSLNYALGHLTATPVDARVMPHNVLERCYTIFSIVCSLMVLGTAISKLAATFEELNKVSSEAATTRRQLRGYLKASETPAELAARVI